MSFFLASLLIVLLFPGCSPDKTTSGHVTVASTTTALPLSPDIKLPAPRFEGNMSLEQTLLERRSIRDYTTEPLKLDEVSQLLWAGQGITAQWGGRTAPSAGGLFPLETYVVVGKVEGLAAGAYKYRPESHELLKVKDGDLREKMAVANLGQTWVKESAINIVIAAVFQRTTVKYGDRGIRYVYMEAGHACQNIYLQTTALNLGMVTIGAFHDSQVKEILGMPEDESPLYVITVGRKKD